MMLHNSIYIGKEIRVTLRNFNFLMSNIVNNNSFDHKQTNWEQSVFKYLAS